MAINDWLFLLLLLITIVGSILLKKLTVGGALAATLIGCFIYKGAGFTGIAMIGAFFLLGTLATSWRFKTKIKLGAAVTSDRKRTASQVLANGGVAGMGGLLSWMIPEWSFMMILLMAGALASATADTLSSELGTLYGKNFYSVIGFKPGRRGDNGVVSWEGSFIGILGSVIIAVIHATGFGYTKLFGVIVLAGTMGNFTDSLLGATLERKQLLKNDGVNFLNTLVAGLLACGIAMVFNTI